MNKKSFINLSFLFLFIFSFPLILFSQEKNQSNVSLVDVLQDLEKKYGVSFSYNYASLSQITLSNNIECTSLPQCIDQLNKNTPLKFEQSANSNYVIIPERKNIQFKVIDFETKETVPSLTIQVNKNKSQYLIPKNSIYELENIFVLDSIHIHSDFYKSVHLTALELQNLQKPLALGIEQINLNEVVIPNYITSGINTKISEHQLQVKMNALKTLAGETDGDIFNILKNIPGIQTPSSKPGSLVVRGSTFDHTLLQIDDIPIYHNGHFFGAFSPYNPSLVENIEVQRNTLSAKWGGRVGGLINMTTVNKIEDTARFSAIANTIYAGVTTKIPLVKNKLGLFIGARSSYPNFTSPKLTTFSTLNFQGSRLESVAESINTNKENFDMLFYDMNAKLVYDANKKNKISISFINIQNRLSAQLSENTDNGIEKDFRNVSLNNWGLTAKWSTQFFNKLKGELRFSKSFFDVYNESEGFEQDVRSSFEEFENTIDDTRFISELEYKMNTKLSFEAGYTLTNHQITTRERIELSDIFKEDQQNGLVHSLFGLSKYNWNDKLTTNIGLHSDYYKPTKEFFVDPRLTLSYKLNNVLFFKASAGRTHQFIQKKYNEDFDDFKIENQFWFLANNTDTAVLESYQATLGGFYKTSNWLFDMELYVKDTRELTKQFISGETDLKGNTIGLGMDLFIKKKWNKLETWLSYSVGKIDTDFNGIEPAFFDQRHIVNVTSILDLNQWEFALSWGYLTGMPVVIPDDFTGTGSEIPYSDRFPSQHQLDLSTTYTFVNKSKKLESIIGLSFVNIYNRDNIINIFQNSSEIAYRKAVGFAPNLQVSVKF